MNRLVRCNAGAGAAEFALVVPVLFFLLFGIVDFGRYIYTSSTLQDAVVRTARMAKVRSNVSGNPVTVPQIEAYAKARAAGADISACDSNIATYAGPNLPGSSLTIRLSCPFTFQIPGLSQFTLKVTQQVTVTISA